MGEPTNSGNTSFSIDNAHKRKYIRTSWDKFNSQIVINLARKIYFEHLSNSNYNTKPKGVVINKYKHTGKVVYSNPLLLPQEEFIRTKYITKKNT